MKRALLSMFVLMAGCVADEGANPHLDACESDGDCPSGTCYRGFCLDGVDAGDVCPPEDVCYDGEDATRGVGVCRAGCRVDVPGSGAVCFDQALPGEELCNGVDDDCDEAVDEDFPLDTPVQCGSCDAQCDMAETCCGIVGGGHECANLGSDPDHCGDCDTRCGAGQACCGSDGCVDIQTDELNCGACGNECPAGRECCGGRCVDPRSSNEHCGGCDSACAGTPSSMCCPAAAMPSDIDCRPEADCVTCTGCDGPTDLCCAGTCVDQATDPLNCGGCGIACAEGERCCGGSCTSADMACGDCETTCGGTEQCCDDTCVPDLDPANCNGCDISCGGGQTCCPSGCANLMDDDRNCGTCGEICAGEQCTNGHCCPAGQTYCDSVGDCVNTAGNESHCGDCDVRCTGLETCNRGLVGTQPWGCRVL